MNQRVRNRRQERKRRRFVRVDVPVRERAVAGVRRVRIDREGVPLDDRARQIELRVLIPSAAAVKVRGDAERQEEEPLRDALVNGGAGG